jgi:hypothetical protein
MANYLQDIELSVNEKIAQGELNTALILITKFVESIVQDSRATAKVFGSATLDNLCQKIGASTLSERIELVQNKSESAHTLIIYIASELYLTGGHTAVVEDFVRFQPDKKHLILITDIFNTGENESIKNRFLTLSPEIEWAPRGTHLEKLYWLQEQLILRQPSKVFLFNHHQDAVAIAAVQPALASKLIFYHHCDHQLCLGLYLSHAKHIDLHSFGYYNCRNNLGVKNNIYIPLVADDLNPRPANLNFIGDGKLRTCSSGGGHKFEEPYSYTYAEEVPKILTITEGWHIHIGYLSSQTLDTITRELEKIGIDLDRFIYIPWVKSIWQAMHDLRIDVYISSFPLGGGRASVEVMGSGTPIIGHQNYHSRLLSGADIIYPEAFFWSKPDRLYSYLKSLTQELLFEQSVLSRKHYDRYHTSMIFIQCLENLNSGKELLFPVALKEYFRDELKVFLDDTTPLNLQLEILQSQLQQTQLQQTQTQTQLQQTQLQQTQTQTQLQQTQTQLQYCQEKVILMEASKFEKLRKVWVRLKKIVLT